MEGLLQPSHLMFILAIIAIVIAVNKGRREPHPPAIAPAYRSYSGSSQEIASQAPNHAEEFCTHCGAPMAGDLKFCGNCGCTRTGTCQVCGVLGLNGKNFCPHCGAEQRMAVLSAIPADIDPYYREEFSKIAENRGYTGKFNWAAFLLGGFWALYRGLWLPALLALVGGLFTFGLVAVAYWFILGVRGNLMYYKKVVKGENVLF